MAQTATSLINRPAWVDLATSDAGAARDFYSRLFGWNVEVSKDPQYGGYGTAKLGEDSAAGIGPKQSREQPTVWSLYIGADDIDAIAQKVTSAGGSVLAPPFDVGDQGRMAVFADPTGAAISAWQAAAMTHFVANRPGAFAWAEVNARGVQNAIPFYQQVFGWTHKSSPMGDNVPPYNEFQIDDQSIAGAWEMNPNMPAEMPSYWLVYFSTDDVDGSTSRAKELGANVLVEPQDYPGGRFSVVTDPQGATFGLMSSSE